MDAGAHDRNIGRPAAEAMKALLVELGYILDDGEVLEAGQRGGGPDRRGAAAGTGGRVISPTAAWVRRVVPNGHVLPCALPYAVRLLSRYQSGCGCSHQACC